MRGQLSDALAAHGLTPVAPPVSVSGGDICDAWRLETDSGRVFLKTLGATHAGVLESEAAGLKAIAQTETIRVPHVLGQGATSDTTWLALEWLDLGSGGRDAEHALGTQLAAMHRHTSPKHGWDGDNWIGRTSQLNDWCADWTTFFGERRLRHQLELACRAGFARALRAPGDALLARLPDLLAGHTPEPSLLHGDLWGGNWGVAAGTPVIFDPAVYYGDREADLAMTRLFGGFGSAFYEAYDAAWPLPPGAGARDALYRLYHVLNHANLFGGGYVTQAAHLMEALLIEMT
ncbi:MAG: fructosamine kinase family protein [Pseudomonadota bacterium]